MRILGFLFRLALMVGLVVWLADRPGSAQIVWRDTVIETSAAVLAVIVLAVAYAAVLLHRLWRFLWDGPRFWKLRRQISKMEEGQADLAKGLAAVAAGQAAEAGRLAVKARKLLGETPVTRLLMAQSAQLSGDVLAAKSQFQAMTRDAETSVLGYRGLIMMALRKGDLEEASRQARLLEETKAEVPWLHLVRFETSARLENWTTAREALVLARKGNALPAKVADRQQAALLLADAQLALRDNLPVKALELAEQAKSLQPDWLPALLVLAEAQIATRHERAALRLIEKVWNRNPNILFIPLYHRALGMPKPIDFLKQVEKLTKGTRDNAQSALALADVALKANVWGEARKILSALVSGGKATQLAYQFLARLEMAERKDERAAGQWLAKSVGALADPQFICTSCGAGHDVWGATCPICHAFNRMEWGVRGQGVASVQGDRLLMLDYLS